MLRPSSIIVLLLASCSNRFDVSLCFITSPNKITPTYSKLQNQFVGRDKERLTRIPRYSSIDVSCQGRVTATASVENRRRLLIEIASAGRQSIENVYDIFAKFIFFFNATVRNFKMTEASLPLDVRNGRLATQDRQYTSKIESESEENPKNRKPRQNHSAPFLKEIQTKLFIFFTTSLIQKDYIFKKASKTSTASKISLSNIQRKKRVNSKVNVAEMFGKIERDGDKLSSRIVKQSIKSLISNAAMHTRNLKVQTTDCKLSDVLNGKIKEATMTFDRLAFRNLKISAGGSLMARNIVLAPLSFVAKFVPRFSDPFELVAQHCTLTQDDVMNSSCMRNGLQKLLNLILKRVLLNASVRETIMTLSVNQVRILGENKIACQGVGITVLGAPFPFEVHTGIDLTDNGHVLRFPNIELVINPGFFEARVPIHKFLPVSVDIGRNAKIEKLHIDGKYERIHLDCKATIIPSKTSMAHYRSIDDVLDAKFFCDVGVWLTRILRFDNSI